MLGLKSNHVGMLVIGAPDKHMARTIVSWSNPDDTYIRFSYIQNCDESKCHRLAF